MEICFLCFWWVYCFIYYEAKHIKRNVTRLRYNFSFVFMLYVCGKSLNICIQYSIDSGKTQFSWYFVSQKLRDKRVFLYKVVPSYEETSFLTTFCMGWRIPSLFKSTNFLSHQLSHLTAVPHIHLAMATKPPQLIKASFTLYN